MTLLCACVHLFVWSEDVLLNLPVVLLILFEWRVALGWCEVVFRLIDFHSANLNPDHLR
jgi:hypothetical protein